ncbi:3-ketoacyl-ACP reductase [Paenibacillus selenitireducens]|uniref:3-ketoacyl-ACP reductase n=1 Tax=Paenibacillus selenitireducens TaxID=1324314 RepID=A0A1T2XAI6_9BACL|nr:SDR family oxidoreductase [Paenibacillus selenitireducens]OPA76822.1 3-ketoacyl-ACP reductase [Paenibacillus selenitireducens]
MDLQHKVVLVTGGATGIGRATCIQLAAQGALVAMNYSRSKEEAMDTAQYIRERGGKVITIQADVSKDAEVRQMVEEVVAQFGTIHALINNASITRQIPLEDLESATDEIWDELYDVNVKGMFHCARAVSKWIQQHPQGAIVNVGSVAGLTGSGSSLPYAVSKAAVHGLTKSLARALAPKIRVNCIVPGAVATRWWKGEEDKMYKLSGDLLLQRISTPEDIAASICAMLQQDSMTGQVITVDNGQTL